MLALTRHPCGPSIADSVTVEWEWTGDQRLWLRYHVEVVLADLKLPDPSAKPCRADGLWRSTCFELFLREPGESRYYEFNFSPSRDWAAYSFADTRTTQAELALPAAPEIYLDASETHFAVEASVSLPELLRGPAFDGAVSAVIGENSGMNSYWALHHSNPRKPDFHHSDCFVADLSPPVQS